MAPGRGALLTHGGPQPGTAPATAGGGPTRGGVERRPLVARSLWVLGVLGSGSMVGVVSSLYLVNHHPLLLVALSPLGRHLVLVAPIVDPVALVVVVVARRMAFYLASFHLGRGLGASGIVWLEVRAARFGRFVRWVEYFFRRASHLVVLVMAGPTVSALAGISGMRVGVFAGLATPGLVVRVLVLIEFADVFRAPIEQVLAWIDEHWVPGTILLVAGTAIYQWRRVRALRPGDPARGRTLP